METIRNYAGGRFDEAEQAGWLDVVEPATGRVYAQVPDSDADDVDQAVACAMGAFPAWSARPAA